MCSESDDNINPLRIAVLVKQIPALEGISLDKNGRLVREGVELEMNPYCRRAVAQGVKLARAGKGHCTVFTMGPPAARDVLKEALAWGADTGVLLNDPAFAGADTLATAHTLAEAIRQRGPFDLILLGRNSLDADTGQVGPELAELLGLPFLGPARKLEHTANALKLRCEHDDGWMEASVSLPAVVSAAERLCAPCKVPREKWSSNLDDHISTLNAAALGKGPWGSAGSPTRVGDSRTIPVERSPVMLNGLIDEQVKAVVHLLEARGVFAEPSHVALSEVPAKQAGEQTVVVLLEPGQHRPNQECCGTAALLAAEIGAEVTAFVAEKMSPGTLGGWGIDRAIHLHGSDVDEDIAHAVSDWAQSHQPWAIIAPSTQWGRIVASRIAARLQAGLTGDAIALEVREGRLVAWKPAFAGMLAVEILCTSPVQMATVRPGALPLLQPRKATARIVEQRIAADSRISIHRRTQNDEIDALANARTVIGVGMGVPPDEYDELEELQEVLGAELAATRKVTDRGWQPRSRQIGITGRAIAPQLYLALGLSGKFTHSAGIRNAATVLAVNTDEEAPIFEFADIGMVADWREVIGPLAEALAEVLPPQPGLENS